MTRIAWLSALALSAGLCTASFGQVTGTVKLEGKPPKRVAVAGVGTVKECAAQHKDPLLDETVVTDENGDLANVAVYLKDTKGPVPTEPVKLDQKGCQYVPHVVTVMVGQPLMVTNSDGFLHNVHTLPADNDPSNIAQPTKDEKGVTLKPLKTPETFKVKCDVHPWMGAWVVALDTPYSAVTGDDGTYSIDTKGLKDGTYDIIFWQEKYHEQDGGKITIKNGKAEKDFTFKQKAAAADGAKDAKTAVAAK